jgi:glutaredoxin-related protein
MPRQILDETHIHPAIREKISTYQAEVVREVQTAVATHPVVVIGMRQNPFPKKARALLDANKIVYEYLEYGSYFGEWRRRGALRIWTGWPTFPMIFVKGTLIGGYEDLKKLIDSGEFAKLLNG